MMRPFGYFVRTAAFERFSKEVVSSLVADVRSIVVHGPSDSAKTHASLKLAQEIRREVGPVSHSVLSPPDDKSPAHYSASVLNDLLAGFGVASFKVCPSTIEERVARHALFEARRDGRSQVVFIVDKVHAARISAYLVLEHLRCRLETCGIRAQFVLVMNTTGLVARQALERVGRIDEARLLEKPLAYPHLLLSTEIRQFLGAYDSVLMHPKGSGISFSQAFAPHWWNAGWRLAQCADYFNAWLQREAATRGVSVVTHVGQARLSQFAKSVLIAANRQLKDNGSDSTQAIEKVIVETLKKCSMNPTKVS